MQFEPRDQFEQRQKKLQQIQALVQRKAKVLVYSSLPEEVVRACHLIPCRHISAEVKHCLDGLGPAARVAVLPQGPLTIPYLGPAA